MIKTVCFVVIILCSCISIIYSLETLRVLKKCQRSINSMSNRIEPTCQATFPCNGRNQLGDCMSGGELFGKSEKCRYYHGRD